MDYHLFSDKGSLDSTTTGLGMKISWITCVINGIPFTHLTLLPKDLFITILADAHFLDKSSFSSISIEMYELLLDPALCLSNFLKVLGWRLTPKYLKLSVILARKIFLVYQHVQVC
jgi:hypothetical protein